MVKAFLSLPQVLPAIGSSASFSRLEAGASFVRDCHAHKCQEWIECDDENLRFLQPPFSPEVEQCF